MTEVGLAVATTSEEALHCFVCDVAVTGKHYTLATCRTQSTNIRLIEKLGQLVGERYMVVICEDDIICRGCANLINTLDRLETEMNSVRKVVLQFLEKKYALEEGELINNKSSNYGPPPQITSRNMSPQSSVPESFMYQKRKAALMELENECRSGMSEKNKKSNSKNDVWMQCDKCKYTTHYNAFMIHHVRQHVKRKQKSVCEFCGSTSDSPDGQCPQNCCMKSSPNSFVTATSVEQSGQSLDIDGSKQRSRQECDPLKRSDSDAETVEMIAAEINEFTGSNRNRSEIVIPSVQENSSNDNITEMGTNNNIIECENEQNASCVNSRESLSSSIVRNEEMMIPVTEMTPEQVQQQITARNLEVQMDGQEVGSTPTAICVMEMSEDQAPESTLVTVQKMEDDNNAVYVQVVEVGKDGDIDEASNIPKVLTVSDDGTVEMVEVMWDDMVATDVEPGQTLQF